MILWKSHWIVPECEKPSTAPNNQEKPMTTPTAMPFRHDARTASFKLATINPGDVVEVETTSGSLWTLVRTARSQPKGDYMTHMVMMTTSTAAGQILRDWREIWPQNVIKLGDSISFGNWLTPSGRKMHTGPVAKVYVNGVRAL